MDIIISSLILKPQKISATGSKMIKLVIFLLVFGRIKASDDSVLVDYDAFAYQCSDCITTQSRL